MSGIGVGCDFGLSCTDLVQTGADGSILCKCFPYIGSPHTEDLCGLLKKTGLNLDQLSHLAVTGGRHRELPEQLDATPLIKVNELDAIGAVVFSEQCAPAWPTLVISTGTGTACVHVEEDGTSTHAGGTAVGGGTLVGLGGLTLGTQDATRIDALAAKGDPAGVNLLLGEVVAGPIGVLPPEATASNFGKISRQSSSRHISKEDIAAGLIAMVAETLARIGTEAARRTGAKSICVIGRTSSLPKVRERMQFVLEWADLPVHFVSDPGSATARGALAFAQR